MVLEQSISQSSILNVVNWQGTTSALYEGQVNGIPDIGHTWITIFSFLPLFSKIKDITK